jgi:exosortase
MNLVHRLARGRGRFWENIFTPATEAKTGCIDSCCTIPWLFFSLKHYASVARFSSRSRPDPRNSHLFNDLVFLTTAGFIRRIGIRIGRADFTLHARHISLILTLPPRADSRYTKRNLRLVSQLVQTERPTAPPTKTLLAARPNAYFPAVMPVWQLAVLGALFLWLYWSTLGHLFGQWWHDPNFSHGFFVPLFSAFVVWHERHRLAKLRPNPSWTGLAVLALALALLLLGQLGAELFLARLSLVILLAGLVLLFLGSNFLRALLFPLAFLLLMIPIPAILFNQITFPLQIEASRVATFVLRLLGVPVLREGNVIILPVMSLEVAEACSGIRSLMSLTTLAVIYGYLMERRIWLRVLLALASIPIAIVANSVRIIGTGLLVQYWDADKAEGFFHASWGWIIFVLSLILLYALHAAILSLLRRRGEDS